MSNPADVVITTLTSIFLMTTIFGNLLICAIVFRNRDMRITINFLLVNLAVGDITYATFNIPQLVISHINGHPEGMAGRVLCIFRNGVLAWVGEGASVFTLVAIATERYYAVIYPLGNKGKLTIRKLKLIIPGSWILAVIINIPNFCKQDFVEEKNPNYCIYHYDWPQKWMEKAFPLAGICVYMLCFTLMMGLYSRVIHTMCFKRDEYTQHTCQQQAVLKVRKRVTLMVLIVTVIFGMCFGTDFILHVMAVVASYKLSPVAIPVAHVMIMFNAAVNPFAYALVNQRFRQKMKGILVYRLRFSSARVQTTTESPSIGSAWYVTRPRENVLARDPVWSGIELQSYRNSSTVKQ